MGMCKICSDPATNGGGQGMNQGGMDNGSSHGYQKNNGGSNQHLNIPSSTTQSSVGTEASKKSTGVKIIGKVPEANKLKVHSAKADNSTKMRSEERRVG